MALIVAFPYTGVAFAHTETMKMDEPGSVHPPGVCFTLFFYSLSRPPLPPTSLLFFLFSFIRLLSVLSLFNMVKKAVPRAHTGARPALPGPCQTPPAEPPAAGPAPRRARTPHIPVSPGPFPGASPSPPAPLGQTQRRAPRICNYLLTIFPINNA